MRKQAMIATLALAALILLAGCSVGDAAPQAGGASLDSPLSVERSEHGAVGDASRGNGALQDASHGGDENQGENQYDNTSQPGHEGTDAPPNTEPAESQPDTDAETGPAEAPPEPEIVQITFQAGEIDPDKPMIALTFDDGPSKYTTEILDLAEQHNIRVTFCVIGRQLSSHKETMTRAVELGCEIIGHSWDHKWLTEISEDEIRKQLLDTRSAIKSVTGIESNLFRPPYGAVNETVEKIARELGFAIIKWSLDPEDWRTRDADKIFDFIMDNVSDRDIILCHDLYETTVDAVRRAIPKLLEQGYQFVTVSELLTLTGSPILAGNVYVSGR